MHDVPFDRRTILARNDTRDTSYGKWCGQSMFLAETDAYSATTSTFSRLVVLRAMLDIPLSATLVEGLSGAIWGTWLKTCNSN